MGTTAQAGTAGLGTVPPAPARHAAAPAGAIAVAFVGRTSTTTMQDPVESLLRQLRVSRERLPEGFTITRCYWDVESGGTELDRRSQAGEWRRFTDAGIPRDGGMAELRAALRGGKPPFAAVICENIERTGRDTYDALRLEKELDAAGVLILATDEPIDAAAPDHAVRLVRRVKQGIAEYFRYNLKTQMWEGLKEYVISGHNTGPAPYGYAEDRTVHPNPMKASMGATRARLVPDPERGPWVTRMYEWRVYEKLALTSIARRLDQQGAPPPQPGTPWSPDTVRGILANPKYTGRVVIGRTRNTAARPGQPKKVRQVPREHWTWASDDNTHPALVAMELWEAAQLTGRERGNVRDHHDDGRPDHPLRSRVRCAQCRRRMVRKASDAANGKRYAYFVCPHNPNNARHAARYPGHVRASARAADLTAAVDNIITGLLSQDRAAMLTAVLPATQAEASQRTARRAEQLKQQAAQNETAQNGLITQLAHMGNDTTPAANAMRERITAQFNQLFNQGKTIKDELDNLSASQAPAPDATLIDELPYAAANISDAPEHVKARLYAAFDIQALYRQHMKQATIWATVTDDTPGTVAALLADPRTDNDTFGNLPLTAITRKSLRNHAAACRHVTQTGHLGRGAPLIATASYSK